ADAAGQNATVNLRNSILSGTTGGSDLGIRQVAGTATVNAASPHVNVVQSTTLTSGAFNNSGVLTASPNLGALANNGGPTKTLLPGAGPAIDGGINADAAGLTTDQRGLPRISGKAVDLGAVEFQQPTGTVGGVLFIDANASGVRDPGEPGVAGLTVFLDAD